MVKNFIKKGYVFLVLAFLYAPIILLTVYSFNMSKEIGTWSDDWGFGLYGMLFTDPKVKLMKAVYNTLILAFVSAAIATFLGTMGAIGSFHSKKRIKKLFEASTQIPVISAEIVTGISLAMLFVAFGFNKTWASLIIGHVVIGFPFVFLSVLPKLKQLDPNLYEAGLDLGATPLKALFSVILPEIMPGIFSGFLLSVTMSLDDYIITTFTKPATLDTISTFAYNAYAKGGANTSVPALRALSAIIFAVIITVVIVSNISAAKVREKREKTVDKSVIIGKH